MHFELDEEFRMRVKHNFKLYVLLTSKSTNWKEDYILESISKLNGYKSHKTVKYEPKTGETNTSHIHIKFDEESRAREAVDYLKSMNYGLSAILVDDMLRDWFNYEIRSGHNQTWTLTIVDIIGSPPFDLNFLTKDILNSIFQDFGGPYLLPYTAAIKEPHVQVLFNSMTEALAACIAFGEWYDQDQKADSFFYRVRINPSDKEAQLIKKSGGTPIEAFQLDYFVRHETDQKLDSEKKESPRSKRNKSIRKLKGNNSDPAHRVAHRTPVLCVPVVEPLHSYAEALMASGRQLNVDCAALNVKETFPVSTDVVNNVDCKTDSHSSIQIIKEEKVSSHKDVNKLKPLSLTSKQVSLGHVSNSTPENLNLISQKHTRQKRNARTSRVFECRK